MARALKYTIPFASLDNTQYVVNVYVEGFTGTATTMTGAADPFTTSEKNDKEWLTVPVRTQTGYLRVVCEESEWRGLIPTSATSHYVELKKGNDIMWFGFIKPEAFTHSLYSGVDTYEFPIQCPLSVLDGMNLEWDASQSINSFATLLHRVISLSGVTFTNCYFPNNLENLFDDLLATSNTIQYYETAERPQAVLSGAATITEYYLNPKVTALEILKDICQFWGWECHQWGTELYFTAHDEHCGYRKIPFADLTTLTTSYNMQLTAAGYIGVEDAVYMTAKHQVEMALPAREVKVKTDINATSDIMNVDINAVAQFSDMPPGWTPVGDNIVAECLIFRTDYEYPGVQIPGMIVEYEGANGMDAATKTSLENKGILNQYGPVFQRISEFPATGANPNKYNLQDYVFMYAITENGGSAYAYLSLSTIASYSFYQCGIAISANVYCVIAHGVADPGLQAQISVGNYVWTGTIWEYHPDGWRGTWVNIPIGQNSSTDPTHDAVIVNTEIWDTPYQGAEGFVVPVTTPISGTLRIVFRWAQTQEQYCQSETIYPYMRMDSLGVKVFRPSSGSTISPKRENSREYKEEITTQSSESVSVDVKYATDNWNTFGTAFVCTKEGSYMKYLTYWTGDSERPEQHLLDRLVALYSTPTEWREIDVSDANVKYVTPRYTLKDVEGHYWWPVASSRNWVDGIVRITLGKMGSWTEPTGYYLADTWNVLLCDSTGKFLVIGDVPTPQPSLPAPTITPGSGEITLSQTITISISGDATSAEYSTDNETWTTYSAPFTLSADATIYARSTDGNGNYSEVASATYTVLPYDAQVEYLQASGTQYIDTGILPDKDTSIEVDLKLNEIIGSRYILGRYASSQQFYLYISGTKYQYAWSSSYRNATLDWTTDRHLIKLYTDGTLAYLNVDGSDVSSNAVANHSATMTTTLFRGGGGSVGAGVSQNIYGCKMEKNGSTIIDLIPVRVGTTGYMYDKVSGTLFGNAGTGDFILGNDIN